MIKFLLFLSLNLLFREANSSLAAIVVEIQLKIIKMLNIVNFVDIHTVLNVDKNLENFLR
jgi:hypothetical protein